MLLKASGDPALAGRVAGCSSPVWDAARNRGRSWRWPTAS